MARRSKQCVNIILRICMVYVCLLALNRLGRSFQKPRPSPLYKSRPSPPLKIHDNFPLAASADLNLSSLPPIPPWNAPPEPHVEEDTPLFIGFTSNWILLQQVVVSYITAGWPPSDIFVVDNSGVMNSNRDGLLTLQNPFFLNYERLKPTLGVNILITPTLLTFAQLQNFFAHIALGNHWKYYFWAHMDSPVVSDEEYEEEGNYKSLYVRAVDDMRQIMDPAYGKSAMRWYSYDRLELVRTQAIIDVGGWDTLIPYYMTDCDMHERLWMKGFKIEATTVGRIYDIFSSVDDLETFYRRTSQAINVTKPDGRKSTAYYTLLAKLDVMQKAKESDIVRRNTWQWRQHGGQGEPFYRDSDGFGDGIRMTMEFGRDVFAAKWGRRKCNIREAGLTDSDAWRVEPDWERRGIAKMVQAFIGGLYTPLINGS